MHICIVLKAMELIELRIRTAMMPIVILFAKLLRGRTCFLSWIKRIKYIQLKIRIGVSVRKLRILFQI